MKSYPSGKIQEVNAGFKVSLLKGAVVKTFASDEQAVKFTTGIMRDYVKYYHVEAAVSFTRADGIKTYLIFNEKKIPYEISDFRYVQTHSAYFSRSKLRSIIDVHNVSFKGIARVTASGTPMSSTIAWIRIFTSIALFSVLGGLLLWYFANPTQTMLQGYSKDMTTVSLLSALIGCGSLGILLAIFKKFYYHLLIGSRKHRDAEKIHELQQKNWGKFRRITRFTDIVSGFLLPVEIVIIVVMSVFLKDSAFFNNFTEYWQSYLLVIWLAVMLAYLITLFVFALRAGLVVRKLERTLVKMYVPAELQPEYKKFLRNRDDNYETFPYVEGHRMLKNVPLDVTREMQLYQQPLGSEAVKYRRASKKAFNESVKDYKLTHSEIR